MLGHPDLQYVLKDLVKLEQSLHEQKKTKKPFFCTKLVKIISNDFASVISTRATWLVICLLEHKSTQGLLSELLNEKGGAK